MCGVLALLFIAVPALEIYLIITVGGWLGPLPTLGVIVATGIAGAALAKHQGLATLGKLQQSMAEVREVGQSMAEAALVLVAGVMMLTPGFVTDAVGIALLIPPLRRVVAARIVDTARQRMQQRAVIIETYGAAVGYPDDGDDDTGEPPPPGVIDV